MSNSTSAEFSFEKNEERLNTILEPVIFDKNIMFIGSASSFVAFRAQDHGYDTVSAKNASQARDILFCAAFEDKTALPETIFCDLSVGEQQIKNFAAFITLSKEFNSIPFILLGNEKDISRFNVENMQGIDDMVNYNSSFDDIIEKVQLLKRYKSLKSRFPYQPAYSGEKKKYTFENIASRIMDIAISLSLLIALMPLLLLIALAIKIGTKGSVLYISPRAGKGYRVFKFYKFRTMVAGADKKIAQMQHLNQYNDAESKEGKNIFIKIDNDPRVTRLGRFLRNTSLDELPQLINVLIGDMSIVGNRPLPLYEASELTTDEFAERFLAPAGMTGLWQTKGRGHEKMSAEDRINMDIDYAKRHSLLFDMYLLLRTPKGLMQKADV